MAKDAKKHLADIGSAMKADEVAALQREKHELEEKLRAMGVRNCPSCHARFEGGEGHTCMPEKKPPEKKPPKEKPESKPDPKPAADADAAAEPAKEESIFDDFIGPDEE